MTLAVVLVAAYLLGSFPTSYVVVHRLTGRDIRTLGSGNPGTMNVLDSVGFRPAVLVGATDTAKGMAAVGIAYLAGVGDLGAVAAAAIAIIGHDYPIFLRLDGGHGSAAAFGGSLMLLPAAAVLAGGSGLLLALAVRNRRLGGLLAMAGFPTLAMLFDAPPMRIYGAVVLVSLALVQIVRAEGFSLSPVRTRSQR